MGQLYKCPRFSVQFAKCCLFSLPACFSDLICRVVSQGFLVKDHEGFGQCPSEYVEHTARNSLKALAWFLVQDQSGKQTLCLKVYGPDVFLLFP